MIQYRTGQEIVCSRTHEFKQKGIEYAITRGAFGVITKSSGCVGITVEIERRNGDRWTLYLRLYEADDNWEVVP